MPIDTPQDRAALLALCDAATPGPWKFAEGAKFITPNLRPTSKDRVLVMATEDFAFIAAARTELPALVHRLDALEAALERVVTNDKTEYEHHEPRPSDGALPSADGGTCWLTPKQIARAALAASKGGA